MFDITSSKLLILGIVALLVIGPKDLPALLRTIGKYVGIIRGQAKEFRAQFDEAMRETELDQLKKDVENIAAGDRGHRCARPSQTVEKQLDDARQSVDTVDSPSSADPMPRTTPTACRSRTPPARQPTLLPEPVAAPSRRMNDAADLRRRLRQQRASRAAQDRAVRPRSGA